MNPLEQLWNEILDGPRLRWLGASTMRMVVAMSVAFALSMTMLALAWP